MKIAYWIGVVLFAVLYFNGLEMAAWIVGGLAMTLHMKADRAI